MYLLGYDLGSSSLKATLLRADTGQVVASAQSPATEMGMQAPQPGWAEQDPALWWQHLVAATQQLAAAHPQAAAQVKAIGIAYQMHGLVVVNRQGQVLRPAIIWCDSRAVPLGEAAFAQLGPERCLRHLLNSPGNFTAAKLRWVQQNQPELFAQIDKMMLPGDYLGYRLTGELGTTASGLSEGILWDFPAEAPAQLLLDHWQLPAHLLPPLLPTFGPQGQLLASVATELGLPAGTPVTYRAGDQPNNAYSLQVWQPGEVAATAGTSGVVYGINNAFRYDPASRVNTFLHVTHQAAQPATGTLLCVNGTGSQNSWLRANLFAQAGAALPYPQINQLAGQVPPGSEGLVVLPFGNGAERPLGNRDLGGSLHGLQFNSHTRAHVARAAQEGIAAALRYGVDIMRGLGIEARTVRAGDANMFLSPIFAQTFANFTGSVVELYNTDGSQGAARAAGVGAGIFASHAEAFAGLARTRTIEPEVAQTERYQAIYARWLACLERELAS
ncbi:MAG: FGGY family carbohydrate kinase [Bernardetiaceae bacterium]|jgi:xylulokinase|nr:FGGY family carbohydrate kinase [Bernardetiaceae bacterium]